MHEFEVGQSVRLEPNTWYYRSTSDRGVRSEKAITGTERLVRVTCKKLE
jgi:hypothetical protein